MNARGRSRDSTPRGQGGVPLFFSLFFTRITRSNSSFHLWANRGTQNRSYTLGTVRNLKYDQFIRVSMETIDENNKVFHYEMSIISFVRLV